MLTAAYRRANRELGYRLCFSTPLRIDAAHKRATALYEAMHRRENVRRAKVIAGLQAPFGWESV